jgi:hypothetical protein
VSEGNSAQQTLYKKDLMLGILEGQMPKIQSFWRSLGVTTTSTHPTTANDAVTGHSLHFDTKHTIIICIDYQFISSHSTGSMVIPIVMRNSHSVVEKTRNLFETSTRMTYCVCLIKWSIFSLLWYLLEFKVNLWSSVIHKESNKVNDAHWWEMIRTE